MRWLVALLIFSTACGDSGPLTFSERIPDMSDRERHRHCYQCQDKCFRDFQRVSEDEMDKWHSKWSKCLQGCSQRFMMDSDECQYTDKEYMIRRKPREPTKKRQPRTGG